VGRIRAMRMALLGEHLSAVEAYDAGLVTQVVADTEFTAAVGRIVDRLQAGPALVYAATKRAINAATLGDLEDTLDRERTSHSILSGPATASCWAARTSPRGSARSPSGVSLGSASTVCRRPAGRSDGRRPATEGGAPVRQHQRLVTSRSTLA